MSLKGVGIRINGRAIDRKSSPEGKYEIKKIIQFFWAQKILDNLKNNQKIQTPQKSRPGRNPPLIKLTKTDLRKFE